MYYGFSKLDNDYEEKKVQSGKRKYYNRITIGFSGCGATSNMSPEEMLDKFFTKICAGVAKKELADKYKTEYEKTRRELAMILDRVEVLEENISKLEATDTQLFETNVSLSEINEQLTDEFLSRMGE
ncbi:hypothetical protein M9H77_13830 [Catharanthus roseus]|uniref:Uncharacterized protein n=1 Tax=Catharanthus roseus TaxID=4058 RepID=A0ACC0BLJ6_CATRO|nr:hypothetical protein M9H77_13830 [Catharanthus roseus]